MPVNRYYQTTPYEVDLYIPPVQYIGAALAQAQKQYDTNFNTALGLRNKYIQSREIDRARANELQKEFDAEIDSIVEKYQGDYSRATRDLAKLQQKISNSFSPGGEAGAIMHNLALEQESLKAERARLAKGEITEQQLSALKNFYNQQGPTTLDPATGTYSTLQVQELAKYVPIHQKFQETLDKVKPKTIERSYRTGRKANGEVEHATVKKSYIDPNEVWNAFQANVLSDDAFKNYVTQQAVLEGKDPSAVLNNIVEEYRTNVLPSRTGIIEDSAKLDYKADWKYQEDYKQSLRKDLIKFKKRLDVDFDGDRPSSFLTLAQDANHDNKKLELNKIVTRAVGRGFAIERKQQSLKNLMSTRSEKGINYDRLQSIIDANPGRNDTDIVNLYNQAIDKKTGLREYSSISFDEFTTTASQQEEANRIVTAAANGLSEIWVKTENGQIIKLDEKTAKSVGKRWQDPNDRMKSAFPALGKARGSSGHVPSLSTVMPDPDNGGKVYFIAPQRTDIRNYQKQVLDKAFGFLQKPDVKEGEVFPIENGFARGVKLYENGEMQAVYYPVKRGKDGTFWTDTKDPFTTTDPVTGAKYFATTSEIEERLLPASYKKQFYPHKTKAVGENEFLFNN